MVMNITCNLNSVKLKWNLDAQELSMGTHGGHQTPLRGSPLKYADPHIKHIPQSKEGFSGVHPRERSVNSLARGMIQDEVKVRAVEREDEVPTESFCSSVFNFRHPKNSQIIMSKFFP